MHPVHVGGHSALRGTICTRAECLGGHCALGQEVWRDIRTGGHPALRHRQYYHYADTNVLKKLYVSLVCPHLEYAVSIWDPYTAMQGS